MVNKKTPKEALECILASDIHLTERVVISEKFQRELMHLLNKHSIDATLQTNDFKLAKYIVKILKLIPVVK